jgi:hypothetical protein
METRVQKTRRTITNAGALGLTAMLLLSSVATMSSAPAGASSHREAPLISNDPVADNTDTYAFVSPDKPDTVTLIGSWIPGQLPHGGPNYYGFGNDVVYSLNVDNDGDAKADIRFKFEFRTETRNGNTFLYNVGPINGLDDPNWNVRQFGRLTGVYEGVVRQVIDDIPVAPANIGTKSNPDYEPVWLNSVVSAPTGNGEVKVFAGPTDDPFWVDLGSVFDLLTLRGNPPPVGYSRGRKTPTDGLKRFNVHSIAIQVPIADILLGAPAGETVIGVWAASERFSTRVIGDLGAIANSGDLKQVSRLGMPLVNEVVLPLALKDAFNSIPPSTDFDLFSSGSPAGELLKKSVLQPELQGLLNALYGVPYPQADRTDLLSIFLTGMKTAKPFTIQTKSGPVTLDAGFNVNQPMNVRPAEMIRLNTAIKGDLCKPVPDYQLGLLGGDACGFPNGRRLQDDVTDIELLAVAGAAYSVLTNDTFTFNPALIGVLRDNVDINDKMFRASFPYLATPHQGQAWYAGGGPNQNLYGPPMAKGAE